jgi:BirA family biotin operon repressor/biotin-[acetyl-CoA-carboxylase] ligase
VTADPRTFVSRLERFASVPSTQPIVAAWLEEGQPEVAVAVAGEQTEGRGRQGREWVAPPGAALLVSLGFRPRTLPLRHAWRLGATVALAMIDAAEDEAGLKEGTLALKWPNDIVADGPDGFLRKVCGVLGETTSSTDHVETAVVGIGINTDWAARDFPPELAPSMTSLRELSNGRPIDNDRLLSAFLDRLEPRYLLLADDRFDAGGWTVRQRTTGRQVEIRTAEGEWLGQGLGVDPESGALLVETGGRELAVDSGDVVRCRVVGFPTRV